MDYINTLQQHNLKATPQRIAIVQILHSNGHLNIDELYIKLKKISPSISLATVYKNINIMCKKLFLSELKIPNKKNVYELQKSEHSHTICLKCGDIQDIILDTSNLLSKIKDNKGFRLNKSSVILQGVCLQCQKS